MQNYFKQYDYDLRLEWGKQGLITLKEECDVLIIIDCLSFSTCVDIALSQKAHVLPYSWKNKKALDFAKNHEAILAGPRNLEQVSLSPYSLKSLAQGQKIVLPSPNGATLSLLSLGTPTFTACFRNAHTVALAAQSIGHTIGLIPAGERWPDGSLRPALEDLIGAGAVLSHLQGSCSPEADMAKQAYQNLDWNQLASCISARELIERGFGLDVELAFSESSGRTAPFYKDGRYIHFGDR